MDPDLHEFAFFARIRILNFLGERIQIRIPDLDPRPQIGYLINLLA
jgi:hypothetical protein